MQTTDTIYLNILKATVTNQPVTELLSDDTEKQISALAGRHYTSAFLLPYIKGTTISQLQKQQVRQLLLNYYQIEHFTQKISSLFEQHQIPYFLLKGISLAAYYPEPEYRKLGDVDLYINDSAALEKAKRVLTQNDFTEINELSDHHLTFQYTFPLTGASYILELHFRIVGLYQYAPANKLIDQIYAPGHLQPEMQQLHDHTYPVLPPNEYVFYMLHHMLKHYLYSGFGIRLLLDFTLYLNVRYQEVDFSLIHSWCRQSHILHFYEIILTCCRQLGLHPSVDSEITADVTDSQTFLTRVLNERDMGTVKASTLVGSGVYKTITPLTYFKEGHLQMHVRFPRLGKCFLLWPVLWSITLICFLRNTYKLRHTTLRDTLQSFRQTNQSARQIHIFNDSDC